MSPDASGPFRVGLLGHGTVGAAFQELLEQRADAIEQEVGRRPEISGVLTRSRGEFDDLLERSEMIVELIGGTEPALDYVLRAMRAGRHVVTANKQLLSQHGDELFATAYEHQVQLRFEAAVAGVVPAIRVMAETLAAAHIERVHGIVNGTTNFILSAMEETGASYDEALREAQQLGFAEADPTEDVTGKDAAAKMAILARLAFAAPVRLDQVPHEGIENLTAEDIEYAKELGLSLKLIGTAERIDGGIAVHVYPAFLYGGHPLASVRGSFNAVTIESPAITEITLSGPGRRRHPDGLGGAGRRGVGDDPAADAAAARDRAADRDRRGVGLLPPPRGGRPPGRARAGRRDPRDAGRLDQVGGAEGPRRRRAPRDGHAPGARSRSSGRRWS